ncbi:flavin-containing monooxygenase FMO GS-OX4 isoform X1 [Nasonia vitripennis]|uniref:Flavin-containing monooxygenase n=2 Tax=Nasonia vitripennis TaxID=7425 RepID=A0A7M7G497_NASVI|nr:flavin-containing monooxygenase FMO GS-OX4 isoform X1 [Nasonia vitripennis]
MENERISNKPVTKKVCVIGAGAAGLCAARHLAKNSNAGFEFAVFEKTDRVGGTWLYTDRTGKDDNGLPIHSSMYKNLRTNLPKELMNFPDYREIKGGNRSCVSHDVIRDYLEDYAVHFDLKQYIRFNTIVESVKPENDSPFTKWNVKVKHVKTSTNEEYTYDAVMVCNGHFFEPYTPDIPGLSDFKGRVMHSHVYRKPDSFENQNVLVLGASSSGVDIAFEISDRATRVYLSHNNPRLSNKSPLPTKVTEVQGVDKFESGEFVLRDGSRLRCIDSLVFCTGYKFSYPFLQTGSCGLDVDDNFVNPLYKHLVNARRPSMCVVGIPTSVVPFPMFHMQVQYYLSILIGKTRLPSTTAMLEDSNASLQGGKKKRHAHKLADAQWDYNDGLAKDAGIEPLPKFYRRGFELWSVNRTKNLTEYKNLSMRVGSLDGEDVEIVV